ARAFLHGLDFETAPPDSQGKRRYLLAFNVHLQLKPPLEQRPKHRPLHRRRIRGALRDRLDRISFAADPVRASADANTVLHAESVNIVEGQLILAPTAKDLYAGWCVAIRRPDDRRERHTKG